KGLGKQIKVDLNIFLDKEKSLFDGAITHPHYKPGGFLWKELIAVELFDNHKKLKDFPEEELHRLLYSEPFTIKDAKQKLTYNRKFEGIARKLENAVSGRADDESSEDDKNAYSRYFVYKTCDSCHGTRISERAESVKINDVSIGQLCQMELTDVLAFLGNITGDLSVPVLRKARFVLEQLIEIGVGYLSLDRPVSTLSGGESQRVKMARQLDCNLVDLLYVLDEPTIGLHPRDTQKLLTILNRLKIKGNSIFVVEHDPDMIEAAEWIVDLGPRAGTLGGEVVYNGTFSDFKNAQSITSKYLFSSPRPGHVRKQAQDFYLIENANANNLKNLSVRIPKGLLTCITGVAGSGKSSLIFDCFARQHPEAIVIDQSAIGRSSRANSMTYIGAFDLIRKEFARHTGSEASLFSFNSKGACPKCNGQGTLSFEMFFLDAVKTVCDECEGKRYHSEILELKYKGKNIAEVLDMTVLQALDFFDDHKLLKMLKTLDDVGLGYLNLGQSTSTLSGGESQRLKIASELHKESNIYIMDEPTTGLHLSDIDKFYRIIKSLVDNHNTVVIIEHNLDIIKYADWIIDLGPEGGKNGGEVLFEGTPENLINCEKSYTGKHLLKKI
ncbi:MAG TPA: ATP-binding cassette domain-containing protein, partial [Bacteroidales bacterium]|nr:ATP-binding cassette domain-containing protein [Bacteroidales bacterium]